MNPQTHPPDSDQIRSEYDFSQGVRGKHYQAYRAGTNVVFLESDVAEVFTDSASVNQALRLLVKLAKTRVSATSRSPKELYRPGAVFDAMCRDCIAWAANKAPDRVKTPERSLRHVRS